MNKPFLKTRNAPTSARGASLIMVLLILVVVSLLGVGGAQIALMSERGARNDRDMQIAWQAAEAALVDAELDMSNVRTTVFDSKSQTPFVMGCGTSGQNIGLCTADPSTGKPAWLTVDFTATGGSAATAAFGAYTSRSFAAGATGIQPAKAPRYVIEMVPDPIGDKSNPSFMYRVTSMGFGPRADIQGVLQMIYRL